MGQDESQARGLAGIGQPVPAEHAFATDGQAVTVRADQLKEGVEVIVFDVGVDQFLALAIHDADVHLAGMQIDSAVELGGGCIILHNCNPSWLMGVIRRPWIVITRGVLVTLPAQWPNAIKNQKGFGGSITARSEKGIALLFPSARPVAAVAEPGLGDYTP